MSDVFKSIRLDYYIVKTNYIKLIIIYVLAIFMASLAQPSVIIFVVMAFSVFFSCMVFSIYEKNNLSKLYGILPLGKFKVVIGRYLYALFFGILNVITSGILAYFISLYINKGIDQITILTYLSASFIYYCLAVGVTFPIYFKFGFSKAYIFTMLPLYIVFMTSILISRKADLTNLKKTIQYFSSHQNMIWITGLGVGLILLTISCSLSFLLNKKNEL